MPHTTSISLKSDRFKRKWPASIFENIIYFHDYFPSHESIYRHIKNKSPYTITIINEWLKPEFYRKKDYGKTTRVPIASKYDELIWKAFTDQYGEKTCQEMYAKFLDVYRHIDDVIFERELEPRYKAKILKKYKDLDRLKRPRFRLLFLYNNQNQLLFVKRFPSLRVPFYDIGSNYHLPQRDEEALLRDTTLLKWEDDWLVPRQK